MRLRDKMKAFGAVDVLSHREHISEASRANLFFVKSGRISRPGKDILDGVSCKQVLSLFGGIVVEDIPAEGLFGYDEVFMASTSCDITPVVMVDGRKIGDGRCGPVTREIRKAFREKGWL